ncbi:MAG: ATP-binding cassette domain-containing protein, partial [Chloroflexi bacterium]|nr:ATP-binding cassette domain-containing protein [Chloroflexota bacterium]
MRTAAERAATDAPVLECRSVTLGYGAEPVIRELSLAVAAGETLALLGPSGSGKTTLLYAVAGFVEPRVGEILISGEVVGSTRRRVPPERRSVGVVFQNYALWPHLTALETVAYPLRRSGIGAAEARRRSQGLLDGMGVGRLAA